MRSFTASLATSIRLYNAVTSCPSASLHYMLLHATAVVECHSTTALNTGQPSDFTFNEADVMKKLAQKMAGEESGGGIGLSSGDGERKRERQLMSDMPVKSEGVREATECAVGLLERAVVKSPDSVDALNLLSKVRMYRDEWSLAKEAVKLRITLLKGKILEVTKVKEEVSDQSMIGESGIDFDDELGSALNDLAFVCLEMKLYDEAREALGSVDRITTQNTVRRCSSVPEPKLQHNSDDTSNKATMMAYNIRLLAETGKYNEALDSFSALLKESPYSTALHCTTGTYIYHACPSMEAKVIARYSAFIKAVPSADPISGECELNYLQRQQSDTPYPITADTLPRTPTHTVSATSPTTASTTSRITTESSSTLGNDDDMFSFSPSPNSAKTDVTLTPVASAEDSPLPPLSSAARLRYDSQKMFEKLFGTRTSPRHSRLPSAQQAKFLEFVFRDEGASVIQANKSVPKHKDVFASHLGTVKRHADWGGIVLLAFVPLFLPIGRWMA